MNLAKPLLLLITAFAFYSTLAQKNQASISGKVVNENDQPLSKVSVSVLGKEKGTTTNDSGRFIINVTAGRPFALVFSYTGYKNYQRNFNLLQGEQENITVTLQPQANVLEG
jgi:hypothetical protein